MLQQETSKETLDAFLIANESATYDEMIVYMARAFEYQLDRARDASLLVQAEQLHCKENEDPTAYRAKIYKYINRYCDGRYEMVCMLMPAAFKKNLCGQYLLWIEKQLFHTNHDCTEWTRRIHIKRYC